MPMDECLRGRIHKRLVFLFGDGRAAGLLAAVEKLVAERRGRIKTRQSGWSEKDTLLITYADSIVGNRVPLRELQAFLRAELADAVSFVHLLPFFPYSSDDGFAVQDFRAIRRELGTWDDAAALAEDFRLVFDAVVNHVSASSIYMQGYCAGEPKYTDFFIELDPSTDTSSVLRTRSLPLLHDYETRAGIKWLWTTFSRDQVDLNYRNPNVLLEMLDVLRFYAERGASMIRLDAVAYLWKELGTSCAHLPQTHELIALFRDVLDAAAPHVLLLAEVNTPDRDNLPYLGDRGEEAQMVYNFALSPLILWSIVKGDASVLTQWAQGMKYMGNRATYLNVTATHDGIGMRATEGILSEPERAELVRLAREHNGDVTGKRNADGSIRPYELNVNYFDAVNDPNRAEPLDLQIRRFLLSQSIPMALMGLPGVYIHSLLGSRNDTEAVRRTGRPRSINRQQLHVASLRTELADPASLRARVLASMKCLLRLRTNQREFHPDAEQAVLDTGRAVFAVRRTEPQTGNTILALHNVCGAGVEADVGASSEVFLDLLSGETVAGQRVFLAPYQVRWLRRTCVSGGPRP